MIVKQHLDGGEVQGAGLSKFHFFCVWFAPYRWRSVLFDTISFFALPRTVQGSNPGRKFQFFSTLQHPWHPHFWDSNMPLYMHNFYGQAESGGSQLKIDLRTMLCSKKTFNFESFEFPSWEFKNIFLGVYPHQTRAPCTICIPPNRKGHIDPSFPQGDQ